MTDKQKSFLITIVDQQTFRQPPEATLLEAAEQHNIEIHYHCRQGFCGACRTKLIAGDVAYTTDPLAFIDDDEILPCCCKPVSDLKIQVG